MLRPASRNRIVVSGGLAVHLAIFSRTPSSPAPISIKNAERGGYGGGIVLAIDRSCVGEVGDSELVGLRSPLLAAAAAAAAAATLTGELANGRSATNDVSH